MKTVFADTFYFLGLVNRKDQYHEKVRAAARKLRDRVLTTEWVLVEFADALAESAYRSYVPQFIRNLESDQRTRIVCADSALLHRGLQLYEARPDKEWSLTDCISFTVMKDEGILEALTGDQHFEQAGFVALLK